MRTPFENQHACVLRAGGAGEGACFGKGGGVGRRSSCRVEDAMETRADCFVRWYDTALVIPCIMLLYAFVRLERQTTGSGTGVRKANLLLGWLATDEHSPWMTQRSMA